MFLLTIVLVVVLASHPELRLLLPLVDALGLDLLLLLVSAQLIDYVMPLLFIIRRSVVSPLANRSYSLAIYSLGIMGPYVEARLSVSRLPHAAVA